MTVLEWFFAHFFARFSDIPDVQGLFGEKIYTSQMKGWGAPIWDAVELHMALARWNALVRNITTPELLSGCLNVNLCVEAKEAGTIMKCAQKVRQYIEEKLFKEAKGLVVCEEQAASPLALP